MSFASFNYDTAAIQVFRNTRNQLSANSSLRDWMTASSILLCVLWLVRAWSRHRQLRQLERAVEQRRAVRIDGVRDVRHLSADEFGAIMRSRASNSLHVVRSVRVGAHASHVQFVKRAPGDLALEAHIETSASTLVFVHAGPLDDAVRRLIAAHFKRRAKSAAAVALQQSFDRRPRALAAGDSFDGIAPKPSSLTAATDSQYEMPPSAPPLFQSDAKQLRAGAAAFSRRGAVLRRRRVRDAGADGNGDDDHDGHDIAESREALSCNTDAARAWQVHLMSQARSAQELLDFRASECEWSSAPFWLEPDSQQTVRVPVGVFASLILFCTASCILSPRPRAILLCFRCANTGRARRGLALSFGARPGLHLAPVGRRQ